jgi:hypothetical protein
MTGGWKKNLLKLLLGLHVLLLPAAVLLWGKGYVALTRHLHEGVLYEITSILSPYQWYKFDYRFGSVIGSGGDATLFRSATGDMLYVPVSDTEESGFSDLIIIWGEQMDEDFRYIQPPESPGSLVWVEGVERMGNKEPTLIVYGTVELEREWQSKEMKGGYPKG